MESEPKVSVIMTVYNGQKYLEDSIRAVLQSDYINFELICINDGSTDESDEICRYYCSMYANFKYYRQKNHGLAYSRNLGVKLAKGEFVTFVDADDLISPFMISYLMQIIKRYNAEIAYVELQTFLRETEINRRECKSKEIVCNSEDAVNKYFEKKWGNVCGGMFARNLFYNVRFPRGLIYEDNVAKLQLLINATVIVLTDRPLYYYRKTKNSITTMKISSKNLDILRVGYLQEKIFQNSEKDISKNTKKKGYSMIADMLYDLLDPMLQTEKKWPKILRQVTIGYILKILFTGLIENPEDRMYICIRILKKMILMY